MEPIEAELPPPRASVFTTRNEEIGTGTLSVRALASSIWANMNDASERPDILAYVIENKTKKTICILEDSFNPKWRGNFVFNKTKKLEFLNDVRHNTLLRFGKYRCSVTIERVLLPNIMVGCGTPGIIRIPPFEHSIQVLMYKPGKREKILTDKAKSWLGYVPTVKERMEVPVYVNFPSENVHNDEFLHWINQKREACWKQYVETHGERVTLTSTGGQRAQNTAEAGV